MSPPYSPARASPPMIAPWPAAPEPRALVMGIVNITPDSFSDGGQFRDAAAAIAHGRTLWREGADILDVGGESTRPGAIEISADEEIHRVLPVVIALAGEADAVPISIDTYKAATARAALRAGARIVNDVWGLQRDPDMADAVAEAGAGLVIMHNRTEKAPDIDIVGDIEAFFIRALALADRAGIPRGRIALDPGIGFGKTFEQNLDAIRALPRLAHFGCALLLGVSRKGFLGLITGRPVEERQSASLAANCFGLIAGADIIRVHDVAAHRDAARVVAALAPRAEEPR